MESLNDKSWTLRLFRAFTRKVSCNGSTPLQLQYARDRTTSDYLDRFEVDAHKIVQQIRSYHS